MDKTQTPKLNKKRTRLMQSDGRADRIIVILTALLCIFGLVMIYSSSYYISINSDAPASFYLMRQALYEVIGVVFMIGIYKVDYHWWIKMWPLFLVVGLVLLVVVLVIGETANGSQRWIKVGTFTLMPGEVAKGCIIIAVAGFLSLDPKKANNMKYGIMPILVATCAYVVLIMAQPNMSTAFTIVFIVGGMLFVAGTSMKFLGGLIAFASAAGVFYIFSDEYRIFRVQSMFDPFKDELGTGFQVVQSLLALGSGGLTGLGLGNSVQKNLYLPFPHNDFILSVIGEELGFVGILVLMSVYIVFIWRGLVIAMNAKDFEGMMLASGIVIMLAVQVLMNVAVVTSIMPPTGVILPFISYGGNGLWLFMLTTTILLNVGKTADI